MIWGSCTVRARRATRVTWNSPAVFRAYWNAGREAKVEQEARKPESQPAEFPGPFAPHQDSWFPGFLLPPLPPLPSIHDLVQRVFDDAFGAEGFELRND